MSQSDEITRLLKENKDSKDLWLLRCLILARVLNYMQINCTSVLCADDAKLQVYKDKSPKVIMTDFSMGNEMQFGWFQDIVKESYRGLAYLFLAPDETEFWNDQFDTNTGIRRLKSAAGQLEWCGWKIRTEAKKIEDELRENRG